MLHVREAQGHIGGQGHGRQVLVCMLRLQLGVMVVEGVMVRGVHGLLRLLILMLLHEVRPRFRLLLLGLHALEPLLRLCFLRATHTVVRGTQEQMGGGDRVGVAHSRRATIRANDVHPRLDHHDGL